jgi:abequosyltransferase
MAHLLSICIPTLNRCDYLCEALKSIFDAESVHSKVEVCISNNASEQDYSPVANLLAETPHSLSVCYLVQKERLTIDAHMLAVKNLATSPYIYFLGDDDYFLKGQLPSLLKLIEDEAPDLAIFNGTLVDGENRVIGPHFDLSPHRYRTVASAFNDLRDKGMFGAVLVKKEHLSDQNFERLFGTAHGYGCYWFSLLSASTQPFIVMVPPFPLVALRMAAKNYSRLEVYFRDIPFEISVYQRYLATGLPQELNEQFRAKYLRKISSTIFLAQMFTTGVTTGDIRNINPGFYRQYRLKIHFCEFLARCGGYKLLRRIYRVFFRPK